MNLVRVQTLIDKFVCDYKSLLKLIPLHMRHPYFDSTFDSLGFDDSISDLRQLYHFSGGMHCYSSSRINKLHSSYSIDDPLLLPRFFLFFSLS